jgi:hypothetical protein
VRLKVDVIVAQSTPAVFAAKQATSVIPIVFPVSGDPIGTGLVASLAQPGGNVTGPSLQQRDLGGKRIELLREAVPGLRRLAIMADVGNPVAQLEMREVQANAQALGLDVVTAEIRRTDHSRIRGTQRSCRGCLRGGLTPLERKPRSDQHLGAGSATSISQSAQMGGFFRIHDQSQSLTVHWRSCRSHESPATQHD